MVTFKSSSFFRFFIVLNPPNPSEKVSPQNPCGVISLLTLADPRLAPEVWLTSNTDERQTRRRTFIIFLEISSSSIYLWLQKWSLFSLRILWECKHIHIRIIIHIYILCLYCKRVDLQRLTPPTRVLYFVLISVSD